jgi:hypothetical protein
LEVTRTEPVWVLGQHWMLSRLVACGIDEDRLRHDLHVGTTLDQIDWVARFIRDQPGARVAVVASRLQMPRVRGLAAARGLDLALLSSPLDDEPATEGWGRFRPSYVALRTSRDAIYEHVALVYYRWRGWIGASS